MTKVLGHLPRRKEGLINRQNTQGQCNPLGNQAAKTEKHRDIQ